MKKIVLLMVVLLFVISSVSAITIIEDVNEISDFDIFFGVVKGGAWSYYGTADNVKELSSLDDYDSLYYFGDSFFGCLGEC